jgi:beta-ribofuranosylaminobenzene 5'-phosphate synthase
MKVVVSVPSRVHMTLVDLGQRGYRRNGGIGFAVEAPACHLEFSNTSTFDLGELAGLGFTHAQVAKLCFALADLKGERHLANAITLVSATGPRRHIGMGTGTSVTLACFEALLYLNHAQVKPVELIRMSGRGGTSGIGIHTYFDGGFVADVGRRYDLETIVSSEDIPQPTRPPQLLARHPMPRWPIGLLLLRWPPMTPDHERSVFASLTTDQISPADVHEIAYHSIFGAAAAIATSDFDSFCGAVNALQLTAWKRREIVAHDTAVTSVMGRMRELGCDCVGLSSMGPGLYFLATDFDRVLDCLRDEFPDADVLSTFAANHGREIQDA